MTREALIEVHALLEEVDDIIYRDARSRGPQDFVYTEDEVTLTTIVDEAQGQIVKMLEVQP